MPYRTWTKNCDRALIKILGAYAPVVSHTFTISIKQNSFQTEKFKQNESLIQL